MCKFESQYLSLDKVTLEMKLSLDSINLFNVVVRKVHDFLASKQSSAWDQQLLIPWQLQFHHSIKWLGRNVPTFVMVSPFNSAFPGA